MLPLRLSSLRVANKKSAATKILFALAVLTLVLCMGLGGRLTRTRLRFYCACHAEQGEHFKLSPLFLIVLFFSHVCWVWFGLVWFCLLSCLFPSFLLDAHGGITAVPLSSFLTGNWKFYLISSQILLFLSPVFRMYAQHSGKGFVFNPFFQNYSPCMILRTFTFYGS